MSRVQRPAPGLCPGGVEILPLGEVLSNLDSQRRPVTRSARAAGVYPYYGANGVQDYVDSYLFDGTFLLMGEDGSVVNSDGSPVLNWAAGKIWVNNHAHVLTTRSKRIDLRFAYHYLQTTNISEHVTGSAQPKLNQGSMNRIPIPLPPLEVQRDIVRILDNFTELEEELGQKLEAELEARRSQYAHYRDALLSNAAGSQVALGDLGHLIRGKRFTWNDVIDNGIPAIHYSEIYTKYGVAADRATIHVRTELRPQLRFASPGDVILAAVGETVEDLAKAVAWIGSGPVAIHDDTFLFRSDLNSKYVSYCLQTADFHRQKNRHVARAKVKRISAAGLAQITIPVVPLDEQEHIVEILDQFDTLVNNLSVGLPAELVARRKQYEHYRDRLLTFEEAPS